MAERISECNKARSILKFHNCESGTVPYHLIQMAPIANLHCAECVYMSFEVEVPGVLPMDLGIAYTLFRSLIDPESRPRNEASH